MRFFKLIPVDIKPSEVVKAQEDVLPSSFFELDDVEFKFRSPWTPPFDPDPEVVKVELEVVEVEDEVEEKKDEVEEEVEVVEAKDKVEENENENSLLPLIGPNEPTSGIRLGLRFVVE